MSLAGINKAWFALLALSLATTGMTLLTGMPKALAGGLLLALAGLKARLILSRYLELRRSRFWMRLFDLVIGLFLLIAYAIYLIGSGRLP